MQRRIADDLMPYLNPSPAIESDHPAIRRTAERVINGSKGDPDRAVKLFHFVRDSIHYNIYMISMFLDDFKAATVLERGKGYCVQKAVLLTALGRASGIPTRLAFAAIRNHKMPAHLSMKHGDNILPRHGYTEFFLDDKWVAVAPTFDRKLCNRMNVPTVQFNGSDDALLPQSDLEGNRFIEYVERLGCFADLPLDWIVEATSKIWGQDKRAWPSKGN